MATNLFATAAKTTTAKAGAKPKEEIDVNLIVDEKGKPKYPGAAQLLLNYQKYHKQAQESKTMLETLGAQIKEIGLELWAKKFEDEGKRPESFKLVGTVERENEKHEIIKQEGKLMFISSDSYKKVDEITAAVLEAKYDCIERKETYYFNNELLTKYQDVISKLLVGSKLIEPQDKENLILKLEDVSIRKGTIENVNLIESITGKVSDKELEDDKGNAIPVYEKFKDVKELVASIEPTFSLKNC